MHKSIKAEYIQLTQRMVQILPPHEVSDIALNMLYSMIKIYATVEHNRNMQTAQIFGELQKYQTGMTSSMNHMDVTIKQALEEVRLALMQAEMQQTPPASTLAPPPPPADPSLPPPMAQVIPINRPKKTP